eukprot:gnl/MRDRNA2_/MRDRNA2_27560_c0_seq1.p1 gnl/MRDRNA2_/MRDRNA2_27560_c0~~gnl/MRDRNA2_/MRDRNA2_27560_c0_seq1.p1  ORF type:complete len:391 (-),score=74.17 gnl/MRDRNA2_/MRDRNA2_27560_c0_seq1:57-1229(-)
MPSLPQMKEVLVEAGKPQFRVPIEYDFVKKIGSGAYGCVACFQRKNEKGEKEKVAVKKITNAFDDLIDGKRILREVKLLFHFNHPNIVRILDMFPPESVDFEDIYIVMDLMESDLHRVIYSKQPLTDEHYQYFVHQILRALLYMHTANVLHRDLKPANILVNKNCDLKVCDFGLARGFNEQEEENQAFTDYVVTRWYRAPEVVLLAREYTYAIDVWAVGAILCELIGRKPIFPGKDHLDQIKKIVSVVGTPTEVDLEWLPKQGSARAFLKKIPNAPKITWTNFYPTGNPDGLDMIDKMLHFDPSKRVTVKNALRHKYFEGLFEEADMAVDEGAKPVEWGFDDFEPTKRLLQNYIYCECCKFHSGLIERDRAKLASRGLEEALRKTTDIKF